MKDPTAFLMLETILICFNCMMTANSLDFVINQIDSIGSTLKVDFLATKDRNKKYSVVEDIKEMSDYIKKRGIRFNNTHILFIE